MKKTLLIVLVVLVLTGCNNSSNLADDSANSSTQPLEQNANNEAGSTSKNNSSALEESSPTTSGFNGITPEDFKQIYNELATTYNLNDQIINNFSLTIGDNLDSFKYSFSDNLHIIGTTNKDGTIKEVSTLGDGDLTNETGENILASVGLIIMATNYGYSSDDIQDTLKDLGLFESSTDMNNFRQATVRNGIKYKLAIKDGMTMFSATEAQ
ncbi:hypothetical protein [Paenibacillus glacialis]|uniref:Uncharacterized protein n=1 Tax=Paenibacillus glacialis TaxID=494026 RepID=A0A168DG28_9BACL|nr:hypothetical protein [Paenibacillus glacialis]OAB34165.1 hypothetical protein PGLA_25050 [Paenibacillus glacialis]